MYTYVYTRTSKSTHNFRKKAHYVYTYSTRTVLYTCTVVLHEKGQQKKVLVTKNTHKSVARATARETLLLRARCTSARETLHDDSAKACAQCYVGFF